MSDTHDIKRLVGIFPGGQSADGQAGLTRRLAMVVLAGIISLPAVGQPATPLRLAIIGSGALGGTVGRLWVEAGHLVCFSARDPTEIRAMVAALGTGASMGSPREAAAFGSVVLLAVPYTALPSIGRDLHDVLVGKILLDACNLPINADDPAARAILARGIAETSASYFPGSRYVRAFSAVDATEIAASARRFAEKVAIPLAADDSEALRIAAQLVADAGCDALILRGTSAARGFQQGQPAFRANATLLELRRLLSAEPTSTTPPA